MYNNPYTRNYNPSFNQQNMYEQIDNQINQLQEMKNQMKNNSVQPSINQTFQLAPTHGGMKFVNSIDDVNKEIVYVETPYFSNDLSVLWIKNAKGDVRSYELKEIVQKDDKDLIIESMQMQIKEMKEMIENAKSNSSNVDEPIEVKKSTSVSNGRTSKKK